MATPEAAYVSPGCTVGVTAGSARTAGEVVSCPDGRAGVYPATASGSRGELQTSGVHLVTKPTAFVYLAGQEIYWDASANATCLFPTDDKDFFLGTVQVDTASTDLTCLVNVNVRARGIFDAARDPGRTALVMTTAGSLQWNRSGGSHIAKFGLAAEAQKADLLSVRSVPIASKWIFQAVVTVIADADADVGDLSIGMADGTHASDADTITTSAFFHINMSGADLKIYGESDNAAAEVSATDTTKVFAVGTPFHVMIDGRSGDGSALKYYVNGVRVLTSTAFTVAGAAGPLKALFHLEKSSNDSPGEVALDDMRLWLQDDPAA